MLKGVLLFTMYTRQSSRESVKRGSIVAVDILGNACEQTVIHAARAFKQVGFCDAAAAVQAIALHILIAAAADSCT